MGQNIEDWAEGIRKISAHIEDSERLDWLQSLLQEHHPDADPLFDLHWKVHSERKGIRQAIDEVREAGK